MNNDHPELGGTFTSATTITAIGVEQRTHQLYVRAMDLSPHGNLSPATSFEFAVDTMSPRVVSVSPQDGGTLATGPNIIDVRFSERMNVLSNALHANQLTLSGPGVGDATVICAVWIDERTALIISPSNASSNVGLTSRLDQSSPTDLVMQFSEVLRADNDAAQGIVTGPDTTQKMAAI